MLSAIPGPLGNSVKRQIRCGEKTTCNIETYPLNLIMNSPLQNLLEALL